MTEFIFKLKKDGKTVGYFQIHLGSITGIWFSKDKNHWERCPDKIINGDFDTAHPFVTKDKNGTDVFADDDVKMFSKQYKVLWDERELEYSLQDKYKAKIKLSHTNKNHIELIEDKSNEIS